MEDTAAASGHEPTPPVGSNAATGSAAPDADCLRSSPPSDNKLLQRVPLETLESLQSHFARLGQITVCLCDVSGRTLLKPTWGSHYSEIIGTSPRGQAALCDALRACAANPAARVPSICHDGLSLYTAPIEVDGERLGLIVVGTRYARPPDEAELRAVAQRYELDPKRLLDAARPETAWTGGSPEAVHDFADLLAETIATLFGQAVQIGQQLADLQVVHGLTELLSGTLDMQRILDTTVRRVVEVMPVKACGIRLLNEDTGELVVKAVHNLSPEYLKKGPVMLHENAIDTSAFAGETVYIEDAANDPRIRYPDNARREGIVSGLCAPMTFRGRTIGVIRVYTDHKYRFTDAQEKLLRSIGSQAASAIITSRLIREQTAAEHVRRQVAAAGEIQRRMLPRRPPPRRGIDVGCVYDPSLDVGGDSYDLLDIAGGRLLVTVSDVVGKGLPAALMMASVRAALRAQLDITDDLATVMARVNQHLFRDTLVSEFTTLVAGLLAANGRSITYCNAGHPPPLLLRDDTFRPLTTGGMVIGVDPAAAYEVETLPLRPGDMLVMVSDGVTEAMDFQHQPFGWDRLRASMIRHRALDAQTLARQILWDVRRFVGLADQSDDITILAVKIS